MDASESTIDQRLEELSETYAKGVSELSQHAVLREGLVKAALNEAIWALYRTFPGYWGDIADHLDLMGDVVREQASEDRSTEGAETA